MENVKKLAHLSYFFSVWNHSQETSYFHFKNKKRKLNFKLDFPYYARSSHNKDNFLNFGLQRAQTCYRINSTSIWKRKVSIYY